MPRILVALVVLALVVPARLHAMVLSASPAEEARSHATHHAPKAVQTSSSHADAGHHPAPDRQPDAPAAPHSICLTACLVIPAPPVLAPVPGYRLAGRLAIPAAPWREGTAPPRQDRPPRALS